MRYLVIDLETVTDPSLSPAVKADADTLPPIPYHQVAVMAAALLDARCQLRRIWVVGEGNAERDMLAALVSYLNGQRDITIVTWNGRGFDLPVVLARCLRYGLIFPWYYARREVRHRYSASGHLDVMDFLVDHGAARPYSLDLAAKLIGMSGKLDCRGADVQALIDAGQVEQVRAYCMQDVARTVALFLRTQILRGALDHEAYVGAMESLLAAIEKESRLAPLLPHIDRDRLLFLERATASGAVALRLVAAGGER